MPPASKSPPLALEFDAANATYLPGDRVTGRVVFELKKPLKIRGVRIYLKGEAVAGWGADQMECVSKQLYFDVVITVFGNAEGAILNNPTLSAGPHSYAFSFRLPAELPQSVEAARFGGAPGVVGFVRYSAKARIDVPFGNDKDSEWRVFRVESTFDVNRAADAGRPSSTDHQEVLTGCCCSSGVIEAGLGVLERRAFVPGDEIKVVAQVANSNISKIKFCHLQLVRTMTVYAKNSKGKTESRQSDQVMIDQRLSGPIKKRKELNRYAALEIPDCGADVFVGCDFIAVKYSVRLVISPKGSAPILLSAPVRIGSRRFPFAAPHGAALPPRPPSDAALVAPASPAEEPSSLPDETSPPFNPNFSPGVEIADVVVETSPMEPEAPPPSDVGAISTPYPDDSVAAVAAAVDSSRSSAFFNESVNECAICFVNVKDIAFDCGHLACSECAEQLVDCHICRVKITAKRKIYL